MQKIVALLILIALLAGLGLLWDWHQVENRGGKPQFSTAFNLSNVAKRSALLSVYAVGVGIVIIAGGIDLSLGSLIALTGFLSCHLLGESHAVGAPLLLLAVLAVGVGVGLLHGTLVAYAGLQPFVVTLCGLLAYRGLARVLSQDRTGSLGDQFTTVKFFTSGSLLGLPMPAWIALAVGAAAHVFLRYTIWGRYIYAIGNNEEASLYSGINVRRTKIITYVICSVLGAISGTLEASYIGSVTPSSTGTFYELYAIAAAVLGGCSLRGGQGMVLGILLGAVTIQLIGNVTRLLGVPSQFEYVILGTVILVGALVDASLERYGNRRLQQQQRRAD